MNRKSEHFVYHYGEKPFIDKALTSFGNAAWNKNTIGQDLYSKSGFKSVFENPIYGIRGGYNGIQLYDLKSTNTSNFPQ